MESVFRYMQDWERMTEQMGHWLDLRDAYVTYHKDYVESVWWALSRLLEKNLLYKGHKVVWWWAQGGTALSAVEPEFDYVVVKDGEKKLVVAAALREALAKKIGRELPVVQEAKGAAFLGKRYRPPFEDYYEKF